MICYDCYIQMEMMGIGYICDPPKSVKIYFYECPQCGKSDQREVKLNG